MTPYGEEELTRLLADLESDSAERKESFRGDAPRTVREAVCAFANDLPNHQRPGVVFIGARDDGSPAGLTVTDELLRSLADIKTDGNIVPPPTMTVGKHGLAGAEMAVITVWPADSPPVRFQGRICVRTGPRRGVASSQDERILNERRRSRDRPFDVQPMRAASIADLDLLRFESEYLPAAVAPEVIEANDRSAEQRLAAIDQDPHCLSTLKHYRSLMPLAQEARKPMFALRAADGAIGGHAQAVQDCYRDFRELARAIAQRCGVALP